MGRLLKGTPLNFCNPKQVVWVRTDSGDFPCTAETEINASQVTVVVQDNGTAHAFCASAPKESYRRIIRNQRGYPILVEGAVVSVGPLWGVDVYENIVWPGYAIALRETGKKQVFGTELGLPYVYLPIIYADDDNKTHAFIPVALNGNAARNQALVIHGGSSTLIQFPNDVMASYPSGCRVCNGHFWALPTRLNSPFGEPDEVGFTFNVEDVNGAADVEFFTIAASGTNAQGAVLGIRLGSLLMSGTTPTYPGGPSYPFLYDYEGSARNSSAVDYTTLPSVFNDPPLSPPVAEDEWADEPIKRMTFPLIGGITGPGIIYINGLGIDIDPDFYLGVVSWTGRAVWDTVANTIKVELRGYPWTTFTLETAQLVGQTGLVTFAESTCVANYTLPMLSDVKRGLLILEKFSGTVYRRHGNENQNPSTQGTANERYATETGTHRTFLLGPDGEKPIDPSWQHSIYIPVTTIPRRTDTEVGQTLTMQFQSLSGMSDSYLNYNDPTRVFPSAAGTLLGVPGTSFGKRTWDEGGSSFGGIKSRVSRNTPRADHAAALGEKLAPGAKVYGILYENGKTLQRKNEPPRQLSTVFKGVITASDHSLMSVGAGVLPQYNTFRSDFFRMDSGAQYHLDHISFEVTEIVSDQILSGDYVFFGDYWWGKVPFKQQANNTSLGPIDWVGNLFLDGSLRNIYPTEAYNAAWLAHAGDVNSRYAITEGTFEDTFAGTRLVWDDPYIWRQRRYYDEAGHWEGYVDGKEVHPAEVPRWKLDYSGPEVKCWFDGIELLEPKAPTKGGAIYCDNFQDLAFDRKMVRERGKLNP